MKLSVVIVNYNVKYFLEQCLHSVQNACKGLEAEVFVVDNNSVDGSVRMVREKFPDIYLIENKENTGFSKANNQAIRKSRGEYVLLLNPDTIVEDDTLTKVVQFMDEHPDAGGLGVKMLDGKGKFLPESKRALPSPLVAFFKIFGFSAIFPKSKIFGKYHLGYLDKEKTHSVDVLAGAFMLLRKSLLQKIGLLDEAFFMYGEDVDLSYRITKAGYKNYYYPGTRIIHYKGESTKKSSVNYVFMFYNAMIIFANKHFSKGNARTYSRMINMAIYLRAFFSLATRFMARIFLPLVDAILIFAGIYGITGYWEHNVIFREGGHYPEAFLSIAVPLYVTTWLLCVYLASGYDKPIKLLRIIQGMTAGTIVILLTYSLLSEHYRFSRALIILGASWGVLIMLSVRMLLHLLNINGYRLNSEKNKRFIIVGERDESHRVSDLLERTGLNPAFVGMVSYTHHRGNGNGFIGHLGQIKEIITIHKIDEVIFCAKDVPAQVIIDKMSELQDKLVDYKIAPPESLSIIGSNSINTSGDLYVIDINAITKRSNRRNKRMFDVLAATLLIILYPVVLFIVKRPFGLLRNIIFVLLALRSWVGYALMNETELQRLPEIRRGILTPLDVFHNQEKSAETSARLNMIYARDYKFINDLTIVYHGFRELGRK